MNEELFHKKLSELVAEIGHLPEPERSKLKSLAKETKARHEQIKQTVSRAQEGIDNLRLSIKYLLFDLEATRRENLKLRNQLDGDKPGDGPSDDKA